MLFQSLNFCLLATLLAAAGCTPVPQSDGTQTQTLFANINNGVTPKDPEAFKVRRYRLTVYTVAVPAGTVSQNEALWKRIDEQVLDVRVAEIMRRNGLRVGMAPDTEFQHLQQFVVDPEARASTMLGAAARNVEVHLRSTNESQTIFVLDDKSQPVGRSYDRAENLIMLSFRPSMRHPTEKVRVAICPRVRTRRTAQMFTPLNNEQYRDRLVDENLYDVGLSVELPLDSFLILSPGPGSERETSIGHAWLVEDGPAERIERVIIVKPEIVDGIETEDELTARG